MKPKKNPWWTEVKKREKAKTTRGTWKSKNGKFIYNK